MSLEASTKLQELPRLPKLELQALWQELFARRAHPRLRRNLMIPILAYRIQENAYGGLKPSTYKCLQKLAADQDQDRKTPLSLAPQLSTTVVDRRETELLPAFDSGMSWRGIDDVFASGTNAAGAQCRATRAIAMR